MQLFQQPAHKVSDCFKKNVEDQNHSASTTVEEALLVCIVNNNVHVNIEEIPGDLVQPAMMEEIASIAVALNVEANSKGNWCFGSGAFSHMCHDESNFTELKRVKNQKVRLAVD